LTNIKPAKNDVKSTFATSRCRHNVRRLSADSCWHMATTNPADVGLIMLPGWQLLRLIDNYAGGDRPVRPTA